MLLTRRLLEAGQGAADARWPLFATISHYSLISLILLTLTCDVRTSMSAAAAVLHGVVTLAFLLVKVANPAQSGARVFNGLAGLRGVEMGAERAFTCPT